MLGWLNSKEGKLVFQNGKEQTQGRGKTGHLDCGKSGNLGSAGVLGGGSPASSRLVKRAGPRLRGLSLHFMSRFQHTPPRDTPHRLTRALRGSFVKSVSGGSFRPSQLAGMRTSRHTPFYCSLQIVSFSQTEGKTFHPQKVTARWRLR